MDDNSGVKRGRKSKGPNANSIRVSGKVSTNTKENINNIIAESKGGLSQFVREACEARCKKHTMDGLRLHILNVLESGCSDEELVKKIRNYQYTNSYYNTLLRKKWR